MREWLGAALITCTLATVSTAQDGGVMWSEVLVGSEQERYLRLAQLSGLTGPYPWTVRGFGLPEIERLHPSADHPWGGAFRVWSDSSKLALIRPSIGLIYNSSFPSGGGDGAVWAGRGLTTVLSAGANLRLGPISATFAPVAFRAENASFDLAPVSGSGDPLGDPRTPGRIDLPQRFGEGAYTRIDPGQSTLRLDLGPATFGVSTANQVWGPAGSYPIILGDNAPGFAHLFLGTSQPANLWIGRAHGRLVVGDLRQSEDFSAAANDERRRLMSGLVGTFSPRGLPGLEIGGARFYHLRWPENGVNVDDFLRPFEGLLKSGLSTPDAGGENQLASVFARWIFPTVGFEIYSEFGKEDSNYDFRDFVLEPDHDSAFLVGFQRLWKREDQTRWTALRGELVEADVSHLSQVRPQVYFYSHSERLQGHTHRGQLLGSPAVHGGGGAFIALDRYHPGGRFTSFIEMTRRQEARLANVPSPDEVNDVIYSAGAESLFFRNRLDVTASLTGAWNLNRNFDGDRFNLNAKLLLQARF